MSVDTTGPTSRFYFSQRLRLHYAEWANPGKPPLLLVHGGRDHCRNWDWVVAALRSDWHIIAPDLRGHGDSQWTADGNYWYASFIYDLAQLIHQRGLAPVTIIGHSFGGNVSLRYTGIFPENVKQIVAIEGLGPSPKILAERATKTAAEKMRTWVESSRKLAGRTPRRYPSIEDAFKRMQEENPHLTPEQARHLTVHGVNQNEDGTYSWKFDNNFRVLPPYDLTVPEVQSLWAGITCPTLLVYGRESWATNPVEDGRAAHFNTARVEMVDKAGHWVHHDRFDVFMALLRGFLT